VGEDGGRLKKTKNQKTKIGDENVVYRLVEHGFSM
jgi:hypothetical protein